MSRERRVRRWVRGSIAVVLAILGLFWPDPEMGEWLLNLVVVTLVVLKLAAPRGWELHAKRSTFAVVAWLVVASVANAVWPWWLPAVVVLLLAPLPFLVGITEDFLHHEKTSDRSLIGWVLWAKVRRLLRVSSVLLAWLITWRTSGDLTAAFLLAPAAIATAAGWPSIALVVLTISTPFVAGSSSWRVIGMLSVLVVRRGIGRGGESGSASADLGEDLVGGLLPDERLGVVVPVLDPELDGVDELVDAVEGAAA